MAIGLPCIGSTAGGIPELLAPEDAVPPGNLQALVAKVLEVLARPARLTEMSARGLVRARAYSASILRDRRVQFYKEVRSRTETWLQNQHTAGILA